MIKISTYEEDLQLHFVKKFDFPRPSLLASKWEDFELIEKCIESNLINSAENNKLFVLKSMSLSYSDLLTVAQEASKIEKDDIKWYNFIIENIDKLVLSLQRDSYLEKGKTVEIINKHLSQCMHLIHPYDKLVQYLESYFDFGSFPLQVKSIKVSKVNKKAFATLLNEIYIDFKSENEQLSYDYVLFAKKNISIYKSNILKKSNFTKCTMYTYFKSNTLLKLRKTVS